MPTSTDYRTTVQVKAPADVVFDAIATTKGLTAWWSPATGSGQTDGELRFPMVAGQPPLLVHVEEATRPSTVRWTVTECTFMRDWEGTQPRFTITPIDDGCCELTFEHRGLNDALECKDTCARSWDHFVGTSLRELAEGGPGAPNRSPRDLARRAAEESG
ncbi:MAG TPA: SRPBCC domain-containing protein [Mycobacteriales bacterium]